MRPSSDISALPDELRQQLLAMPLTGDERQDAARALLRMNDPTKSGQFCRNVMKNAPQPGWLRGV
jgi:hypothetical protein